MVRQMRRARIRTPNEDESSYLPVNRKSLPVQTDETEIIELLRNEIDVEVQTDNLPEISGAVPPGGLPGQQQQQLNQSAMVSPNGPPVPNMEPVICPYETTLKDFNSAFRSTPYSSPAHPGSDMDSGLGDVDMDRGINWSSVLSLTSGSQSELDPLNNNTFATEAWPNTANTPTTLSGSVSTVVQQHPTTLTDISSSTVSTLHTVSRPSSPPVLSEYCTTTSSITCTTSTTNTIVNNGTSHHHFDDIGWKLSADDVLKAFPNDENLFAVAGP